MTRGTARGALLAAVYGAALRAGHCQEPARADTGPPVYEALCALCAAVLLLADMLLLGQTPDLPLWDVGGLFMVHAALIGQLISAAPATPTPARR